MCYQSSFKVSLGHSILPWWAYLSREVGRSWTLFTHIPSRALNASSEPLVLLFYLQKTEEDTLSKMSLEGIKINVLLFKINDLSNLIRRLRPKDNNTSRFSWVCPASVIGQLIWFLLMSSLGIRETCSTSRTWVTKFWIYNLNKYNELFNQNPPNKTELWTCLAINITSNK